MECANHPGIGSVGYCKKCGKFGCGECMIKVAITGPIGRQSKATEALLCRECLSGARPDLVLPKASEKPSTQTAARTARARRVAKGVGKLAIAVAVVAVVVAGIAAAFVYYSPGKAARRAMAPDEVATEALLALSAGNVDAFLSCVDVRGFVCGMDSSGLLDRDYEKANRAREKELFATHCDYLKKDFFVPANMKRNYSLVKSEVKENLASVDVKPWIKFGNRLYKRLLLEKRSGEWRISGLASPDY
jgi:hypothetical protein